MTTPAELAYDALLAHLRQQALVASCHELLAWDELTYLPDAATQYRAAQIAFLAGLHHEDATDARVADWLDAIEHSPLVSDPLSDAAVNVRETRRHYDRLARLPRALVEELARLITTGQHEWKLAREQNDFRRFRPCLEQIVFLKRQEAACLDARCTAYDALLAEYEPGFTSADLRIRFAELSTELASLLPEVLDLQQRSPHARRTEIVHREFPPDQQREFCGAMARAVGFDLTCGAVSESVHPFTSLLGPADCRLALRLDRRDLREGLFGTLHELGHALYDQGLPPAHFGTPVGEAASLGVHESQGRLWESAVGRTLGFWQHFWPSLSQLFPVALADTTAMELWRAVNVVEPSLNRVRADEVTYNLHILLRFELEQALIAGDLDVADLPAAWNAGHRRLLGSEPPTDREGCLQDGHWATGLFGYFPTYTLGNLIAAQLAARAEQDLGSLSGVFASGNFAALRNWLKGKLFQHGKRFSTAQLVERATGQPLDCRALINGLRSRHEQLWSE
jgi:carboxypeptidase Taq